jgi:hypothetical protein
MKILYVCLIFIIIILSGCVNSQNLKVDSLLPNNKMMQPLDVVGDVQVSDGEITIKLTAKIRDYPISYNGSIPNITASIALPEQLELVDGKPGFNGLEISGSETIERTIKARAVKNGEGVVELKAISYGPDIYSTFGETERFFILVIDAENGKIKVSNEPFTSISPQGGPEGVTEITPPELPPSNPDGPITTPGNK